MNLYRLCVAMFWGVSLMVGAAEMVSGIEEFRPRKTLRLYVIVSESSPEVQAVGEAEAYNSGRKMEEDAAGPPPSDQRDDGDETPMQKRKHRSYFLSEGAAAVLVFGSIFLMVLTAVICYCRATRRKLWAADR